MSGNMNTNFITGFTFKNNMSEVKQNKNGKDIVYVTLNSSKLEQNQKLTLIISPKLISVYAKTPVEGKTFVKATEEQIAEGKGGFIKISMPPVNDAETIKLLRTTSIKNDDGSFTNKKEVIEVTAQQLENILYETTQKTVDFVKNTNSNELGTVVQSLDDDQEMDFD
ncbi:hypothetical protein [Spiroplasma endosymbiont of Labia minor]|uniref:hypothetical protein n=1 Tax=Spiroplasma endosymbiont of Labia minor TaxID=3066305 RepID=UPI0030D60A61